MLNYSNEYKIINAQILIPHIYNVLILLILLPLPLIEVGLLKILMPKKAEVVMMNVFFVSITKMLQVYQFYH